jgi:hypothetical protein
MTILALRCPSWTAELPSPLDAGVAVAAMPGREELDPLLAPPSPAPAPTRVVVAGTDADLAAVVLRLLRTERLAEVAVAYLPSGSGCSAGGRTPHWAGRCRSVAWRRRSCWTACRTRAR